MNADMFISALGAIDDKFISEYTDIKRKKTNAPAICAIAACFLVLFVGIGFFIVKSPEKAKTYPNGSDCDPPPTVSCNGEYYTIAGKQIKEITDESKLKYIGTVQTYLKAEDWLKNPPTDDFCTNDAEAVGAKLYEYEDEIVIRYKGKLLGCLKQKNTFSSSATTAELYTENGIIKAK